MFSFNLPDILCCLPHTLYRLMILLSLSYSVPLLYLGYTAVHSGYWLKIASQIAQKTVNRKPKVSSGK